jgi:hypothetical protein
MPYLHARLCSGAATSYLPCCAGRIHDSYAALVLVERERPLEAACSSISTPITFNFSPFSVSCAHIPHLVAFGL